MQRLNAQVARLGRALAKVLTALKTMPQLDFKSLSDIVGFLCSDPKPSAVLLHYKSLNYQSLARMLC